MAKTKIKSKKVAKVLSHLNSGIDDCGCYTSKDFYKFAKEFKHMVVEQLSLIGGTDYKQNTGHYFVSGFFTYNNQVYYISLSDVRHFSIEQIINDVLIRTADSYTDYKGGMNHRISIKDNMFADIERIK